MFRFKTKDKFFYKGQMKDLIIMELCYCLGLGRPIVRWNLCKQLDIPYLKDCIWAASPHSGQMIVNGRVSNEIFDTDLS